MHFLESCALICIFLIIPTAAEGASVSGKFTIHCIIRRYARITYPVDDNVLVNSFSIAVKWNLWKSGYFCINQTTIPTIQTTKFMDLEECQTYCQDQGATILFHRTEDNHACVCCSDSTSFSYSRGANVYTIYGTASISI